MKQRKRSSLLEAVANVAVGIGVACAAQVIIFPWFGIFIPFTDTLGIALVMTCISIPRGYLVRRFFEHLRVKGVLP